jgi:hypothetical protein
MGTTPPQIRPMTIGDLLDAAFRLYREHFLTFIGIVALLQVPMAMLQFLVQIPYMQALQRFTTRPPIIRPGQGFFDIFPLRELLPYYALLALLGVIQYLVVYNLITGALANAISRSYMGRPTSILGAYSFGSRRMIALILASLAPFAIALAFAAIVAGCIIATLPILGARSGEDPNVGLAVVAVLGIIAVIGLLLLATLFFYVRLLFTTQSIVLEGQGALAGLARSWRLVGQSFWRTLGITLLVYVFIYIISLIIQLPVIAFAAISGIILTNVTLYQILNLLAAYVVLILVQPLQFAIFTLLYYDLRVRKEGYDIELRAQEVAIS